MIAISGSEFLKEEGFRKKISYDSELTGLLERSAWVKGVNGGKKATATEAWSGYS